MGEGTLPVMAEGSLFHVRVAAAQEVIKMISDMCAIISKSLAGHKGPTPAASHAASEDRPPVRSSCLSLALSPARRGTFPARNRKWRAFDNSAKKCLIAFVDPQ